MESIHDAIGGHDLDSLKEILKSDPSQLDLRNALEETALHRAVWEGQEEMASLLIEAGADVNAVELNFGNTPLHYSAQSEVPVALAELLIRSGAGIEARNRARETPLLVAAMSNTDVAKVLIEHGASYDLNSAVFLGDTDRARAMLDEDPRRARGGGFGCDFPAVLLPAALQRASREMVELLLAHDVDVKNGSPLFIAIARAFNEPTYGLEVVRLLLDHGAEVKQRREGMSILDFVRKFQSKNKRKVLALLKKYGAEE
jgi:ankyrin repeat protein